MFTSIHRRRLSIAFLATLTVCLSSCSTTPPSAPSTPQSQTQAKTSGFRIAYSTIDPGIPYFAGIVQGMQSKATELGDTITTVANANTNPTTQANNMADLIAQKPDGIMLTPISSTQSIGMAADAQAAGIPVLATMAPVGESYDPPLKPGVVGSMQVLPEQSGAEVAKILAQSVPSGSEIGIIMNFAGASTTTGFRDGFVAEMKKAGDYTFFESPNQPKTTASAGLSACQALIASHPDIKGIFSESDEMTVGCIQAPNIGSVKIVGTGGTSAVLSLIKEGRVLGTTCWLPVNFGQSAVQLFHDILAGKEQSGTIKNYAVPGITSDNLDQCPLSGNAS